MMMMTQLEKQQESENLFFFFCSFFLPWLKFKKDDKDGLWPGKIAHN